MDAHNTRSALTLCAGCPRQVVTYFLIIASVVGVFGVLTIPDMAREGADFIRRLQTETVWVVLVEKMRSGMGCAHRAMAAPQKRCKRAL